MFNFLKNKKILLLLFITITLTLTACNDEEELGDIQGDIVEVENDETSGEDSDEEEGKEDKDNNVDEKISKGEISAFEGDVIEYERVNSIYRDQLNPRIRKTFDEIDKAIREVKSEIILKTVAPEEDIQRIMNIMILDKPEHFYLSDRYSYEVNKDKNVVKVKFNYLGTESSIKKMIEDRNNHIETLYNENRTDLSKYEFISSLYSSSLSNNYPYIDISDEENLERIKSDFENNIVQKDPDVRDIEDFSLADEDINAYLNSIYINKNNSSRLSVNKRMLDDFRSMGINSALVLGEIVSYDFIENGKVEAEDGNFIYEGNSYIPKFVHHKNLTEVKRDGNTVTVRNNFNRAHSWLIVEINKEWYNLDAVMEKVANDKIQNDLNINVSDLNLFNLVPDYLLSGTRISNYNEEVLGITPAADGEAASNRLGDDSFISKSGVGFFLSDIKDRVYQLTSLTSNDKHYSMKLQFKNSLDMEEYETLFRDYIQENKDEMFNGKFFYKTKAYKDLNLLIIYDINFE